MPNGETSSTEDQGHHHDGFPVPDEPGDRFANVGRTIDGALLGALVGAAFDSCQPCQAELLDRIAGEPLTLARLVELAAVAIAGELAGGVPSHMTTEDDSASTLTAGFRAIVRAGTDRPAEDHAAMYAEALALPVAERRAAAEDALDLLLGLLAMG
jgi:hypothetical protein